MKHVIALSGGKDSTAMALRLRELNPDTPFICLTTLTGNELPVVREHAQKIVRMLLAKWINLAPFEGDGLIALALRENCIPNFRQRFCTRILKLEPTIKWLKENAPCTQYVGLRADEDEGIRAGIEGVIEGVEQRFPMREWGWGIDDVFKYLESRQVVVPERTDCAICYHQRIGEWKALWLNHRDEFEKGIALEAKLGHTLRSPGRDTWPVGLKELGEAFASGREVRERKTRNCDKDATCRICTM